MTTILVIDDDEQIHGYLSQVLEREGYTVRHACDGFEGVRAYRQDPPDLVFSDIFMDRQEGLETIRQLVEEFPNARIIAVSGGGGWIAGNFLYDAEKFGAVATLRKPLERVLLLRTVQEVLGA